MIITKRYNKFFTVILTISGKQWYQNFKILNIRAKLVYYIVHPYSNAQAGAVYWLHEFYYLMARFLQARGANTSPFSW